jgi:hypothetical protein
MRACQATVVGDGRDIEIKAAVEFVAVPGRNLLRKGNHLGHVLGGDGPSGRLPDVERLHVLPIGVGIVLRDIPDGLRLRLRHTLHLVFTIIGIVSEMADVGNVYDMRELEPLEAESATKNVGKYIGAHIADVRVVVDCGTAGIDTRLAFMDGLERFQLARQAVEQL